MKKKWPKSLLRIGGALLLIAIITAGFIAYDFYDSFINNPFNDRDFQESVWREFHQNDDPDNPRGKMAYHLRDEILEKGMSMEEVKALLGDPDYAETDNALKYILGMWTGFRIDYDSFDIYFDEEDGGLTHAEIVQH